MPSVSIYLEVSVAVMVLTLFAPGLEPHPLRATPLMSLIQKSIKWLPLIWSSIKREKLLELAIGYSQFKKNFPLFFLSSLFQSLIEELYTFNQQYYLNNNIEDPTVKESAVKTMMEETIKQLKQYEGTMYIYLYKLVLLFG